MRAIRHIWIIILCWCVTDLSAREEPVLTYTAALIGGIDTAAIVHVVEDRTSDIVYVAGTFTGRISCGALSLDSYRGRDGFILALTRKLVPLWLQNVGGPAEDSVTALSALPTGGIAIAALCGSGSQDIPTYRAGNVTFSGRGNADILIATFHPDGTPGWARNDGADLVDIPESIVVDETGRIAVLGTFTTRTRLGTSFFDVVNGFVTPFLYSLTSDGAVEWISVVDEEAETRPLFRRTPSIMAATLVGEDGPFLRTYDPTGNVMDSRPLPFCNGQVVTGTMIGDIAYHVATETKTCNPGDELTIAWYRTPRSGQQFNRIRYTCGGPNSLATTMTSLDDSTLLVGGRFERSLLFDTISRRPDLVAKAATLRNGFVAAIDTNGRLIWGKVLGSPIWSQVADVSRSRTGFLLSATTRSPDTAVMIQRYAYPSTSIEGEGPSVTAAGRGRIVRPGDALSRSDEPNTGGILHASDGRIIHRFTDGTVPLMPDVPPGLYLLKTDRDILPLLCLP